MRLFFLPGHTGLGAAGLPAVVIGHPVGSLLPSLSSCRSLASSSASRAPGSRRCGLPRRWYPLPFFQRSASY